MNKGIGQLILKIIYVLVAISIIGLGLKLAKNRIPFKLTEILIEDHPVRVAYEEYDKLYGNDQTIFLLIELKKNSQHNFEDKLKVLDQVHWSLGNSTGVDSTTSLKNAEYFLVKKNYIYMDTFIDENGVLSNIAKDQIENPFWEKTLLSADKKHLLVTINLKKSILSTPSEKIHLKTLIEKIDQIASTHPKWNFHLLGVKLAEYYLIHDAQRIQQTITPILLLLMGGLIFYLFRSFKVLGFFYLSMLLSYATTIIFINLSAGGISAYTGFSIFFVLIISTSDLIHYFSVYKQGSHLTVPQRIKETSNRLFTPCLLTSLTTSISFASLMVSDINPIGDLGMYSAAGSVFAFVITFTFLPFGLQLFNFDFQSKKPMPSFKLDKALDYTLKFPWRIISSFLLISAVFIFFTSKLIINDTFYDQFNQTHPLTHSIKSFSKHFQFLDTIELKFQFPNNDVEKNHKIMRKFEKELTNVPHVSHLKTHASFYEYIGQTIKKANFKSDQFDDQDRLTSLYKMALDFGVLDDFYDKDENIYRSIVYLDDSESITTSVASKNIMKIYHENFKDQFDLELMGNATLRNYLNRSLVENMLRSLLLSLGLIFLTFLIIFRSFKFALIGLLPNITPLLFISGLMGVFQIPLETNVILLVCITIGVAVDDTIHFLYPLFNELKQNQDINNALKIVFDKTSKALLGTTFILVLCFPCFFLADLKIYTQTGIFVMLSLLLALLADLLLLPAIISLSAKK